MSLNFSILWTKIIIYMKTVRNSDWLRAVGLIPRSTNFYYHNLAWKTTRRTLNKYWIRNFKPNDVIVFSISVLNSFQFRLLCQANIKTLIKRNWKEFKKQIEKNLTTLGKNYFGSIIYFPKIFLDSIISGDAGDSLEYHNRMKFSTKDRDNDHYNGSCAQDFKGALWYKTCHTCNLNGLYLRGMHTSRGDGVNWYYWRGIYYSLKKTEMKIRP